VLRLGIILFLLATAGAVVLGASRSSAHATIVHSCAATDRQFLQIAQFQVEAVGLYANDYLHGDAKAKDLIEVANTAAGAVRETSPFDPSLQTVRRYLPAMFLQYADAVRMREAGKDAGPHMYRAYLIGARVKGVLHDAQPQLAAVGCDVSNLL
jgi:hypothetical protein